MDNSSITEPQSLRGYKYIDHSDSYTYKMLSSKEDMEGAEWVLNCVVKIKFIVQGDEVEPKGGHLATVHFPNQGTFDTYLPRAAWNSVDQFKAALGQYSRSMPTPFCIMSQSDLQKYGEDRIRNFVGQSSSLEAVTKKRVTRLGRQGDGKTIVFGPNLAFVDRDGVIQSVFIDDSDYAWIPYMLSELTVCAESVDPEVLFENVARLFRNDGLYAFALTLGAVYMGVHYDMVAKSFHRCPTVICVGEISCGKTFAVGSSANFFASNAAALLEHKSLTPAAAREIFSHQCLPILLHDPAAVDAVKTLIEETFECKSVTTVRDRFLPRTSVVITCNKDLLVQLYNLCQMRVLSRCVLVPFREQFREQSARELLRSSGLPTCCLEVVEQLLQMNEHDTVEIADGVDKICHDLTKILQGYGMVESTERIAFNIALTYSSSEKVLGILDKNELVDRNKFFQFLLKDVTKYAATWQNLASSKRKYAEPPIPLSPSKKGPASTPTLSVSEMLRHTIQSLDYKEIGQFMKIVSHNGSSYLAFKENLAVSALSSHKKDTSYLDNCRKNILSIPGSISSASVKFPGTQSGVRAMFIPLAAVSDQVVKLLDGSEEESEDNGSAGTIATNSVSAAPLEKSSVAPVEDSAPVVLSNSADSGSGQASGDPPVESEAEEKAADSRSRSSSPKEQRFPSPPPRGPRAVDRVLQPASATTSSSVASSESGSNQPGSSAGVHFQPGIVSQTAAKEPAQDCTKCGRDFDIPAQKIICQRCNEPYHRDCQGVRNNTFKGLRATEWTCLKCKENPAKKPRKK